MSEHCLKTLKDQKDLICEGEKKEEKIKVVFDS